MTKNPKQKNFFGKLYIVFLYTVDKNDDKK